MVWRSRAGAGRTSLLPNRETPAIFPSASGVPASTAAPPGLIDLVVVAEFDIAGSLTAAAVQARRAGAGLLIALARPRCGFTTDAAIAQRVVVRWRQEMLQLGASRKPGLRPHWRRIWHRLDDLPGRCVPVRTESSHFCGYESPGPPPRCHAAVRDRSAHHSSGLRAGIAVTPGKENHQ